MTATFTNTDPQPSWLTTVLPAAYFTVTNLSCYAPGNGECSFGIISNGTLATNIPIVVTPSLTLQPEMHFRLTILPGDPSPTTSVLQATPNGSLTGGAQANVLYATVLDNYRHPIGGISVNFAGTGAVSLNGQAAGAGASCTTNASGTCSVRATSNNANTYLTAVSALGFDLGSISHNFVAPAVPSGLLSTLTVNPNAQTANGTAADVLIARIRDTNNLAMSGLTVNFPATGAVKFNGGPVNAAVNCVTDTSGECKVNATSTIAGAYATQPTAGGVTVGTFSYNFVAGAAVTAQSTVTVSTNGSVANGSTPVVFLATARDTNGNPVNGAVINFPATANVAFGTGAAGVAGSCTTTSTGTCSLNATSSKAGAYVAAPTLNGTQITTLNYNFVAGAASAVHSGARVVTDNVHGDGTTPAVIEVLLRDAFDNPVAAGVAASFSSSNSDIAFSGAAAGSCTTAGSTGICRVNVTSSQVGGATRNIAVTTGGAALAGSFTAAGFAYGKSPVVLTFSPWVARLQIVKVLSGGAAGAVHAFDYTINGMQAASDTIRLTGNGSASGAVLLGLLPAGVITVTESASAEWPDAPVSASCVDLASATPTVSLGTQIGGQLLIPASHTGSGANLRCTFASVRGEFLAGRIFSDTGVGGTANDGIPNGAEPGLPGVPVTLGDCSGAPYASDRSDGAGQYRLAVPPSLAAGSPLCVETSTASSRRSMGASAGPTALPAGSPTTVAGVALTYTRSSLSDRIALAWPGAGAVPVAPLNFASVPFGSFVQDGRKNGRPGTPVEYAHAFTAGSAGGLSFSVTTPDAAGWTQKVFADPDCLGKTLPDAALLYPPAVSRSVTAGQRVCVVLHTDIPANATAVDLRNTTLQADFTFTNASPALSASYQVHDVTSVSNEALALVKEVRNTTQGTSEFGVTNQAKPGDVLEYRIRYSNTTPSPISHLVINGVTPAFTSFVSATADVTPAGLSACQKTTPASDMPVLCSAADKAEGRKGALQWQFDGTLTPGATGTVLYQVKVD